jgi:1,4-alpha-glucan branching enzyme
MIQKTYLKTKNQCKVKFIAQLGGAERVEIVGLNNDWESPIPMSKKKDGSFALEVSLPKNSQHEFKYLVNGSEWVNEPGADSESPNEYGGTNSVLTL